MEKKPKLIFIYDYEEGRAGNTRRRAIDRLLRELSGYRTVICPGLRSLLNRAKQKPKADAVVTSYRGRLAKDAVRVKNLIKIRTNAVIIEHRIRATEKHGHEQLAKALQRSLFKKVQETLR